MTPVEASAIKLFEPAIHSETDAPLSKSSVALIGLVTTTALCCLGVINPGVGVLMGAGCAMLAKSSTSIDLKSSNIEEAKTSFDSLGLNPVHVILVKKELILVSMGNSKEKLSDPSLDRKITKIAHTLLNSLGGSCFLGKSDDAIGFKICP